MELNREQIVKALEHCGSDEGTCEGCPYCVKRKDGALLPCHITADALALIRELTDSLDRVQKQCGEIIVECDERDAERLKQVARLTKEKERAKADTVWKMQERLRAAPMWFVDKDTIDQIARELLEETNGTES